MIIITGASRGIGQFLLKKFIDEGKEVIGTYNSTMPDSELIKHYIKLDIGKLSEAREIITQAAASHSNLTLINCAGANYNSFAHKADIDSWKNVIDINLIGLSNLIMAILPAMRSAKWGRIINMSSVVAQIGVPGTSAYAASKAGLWGMVKSVAAENARLGITVNNLNLGYFNIGMINEVPEEFQIAIKRQIPIGEFGSPVDIYESVKYIMMTPYLNGTSIDINGGIH
jgi:NAD(P)-dependent dehydrogenase (short-subunit alcohol dehydrogenase family)